MLTEAQIHPLRPGNQGGADPAQERHGHVRAAGQSRRQALTEPSPCAVTRREAAVDVIAADEPHRHDRIAVFGCQAGESTPALPAQDVFLAFELRYLPAPTGKPEHGFAVAPQFSV